MRFSSVIALTCLLTACAVPAVACAAPHTSHAGILAQPAVAVTIVQIPGGAGVQTNAGAAVAELGTVSSNVRRTLPGVAIERRPASYVVVTSIGLRANSTVTNGPVSLQAFLDSPVPGILVRLDGVELSSNPATFAGSVPLNVVSRHRLEIEIPNRLNTGMIPQEIPLEFGATPQ